jgi:hypothetical protein
VNRAALEAAGFRPMLDHHYVENPLRAYLVVPVRDDEGAWFGVPMFYGELPDLDLCRDAERVAVDRYRKRISRRG